MSVLFSRRLRVNPIGQLSEGGGDRGRGSRFVAAALTAKPPVAARPVSLARNPSAVNKAAQGGPHE